MVRISRKTAVAGGVIAISSALLIAACVRAFRRTMEDLGATYKEVIEEVGAFPGFPSSDIVDTGDLRDSQKMEWVGIAKARFSWDVPYALYVHEGYTLRSGGHQPGRPWTKEAHRRFKIRQAFIRNLNYELKSVFGTRKKVKRR